MNVLDMFKLDGKTALVTGCRRGIGKGMAVALAEAGADIVGVSAQLEPSGSEVEQEVTALGRSFRPYQCDFADRKAVYNLIKQARGMPAHRYPGEQRRNDPPHAGGGSPGRILGSGYGD